MSIAIEQLVAELKKPSADERERLIERWAASQEREAISKHTSDGKN